ncbi:MAG: macro domain-containing protein [Erysipelotrichaceae bacterium]|uniref:macro domain-containing protein n=1 Tax=Floccifex sp. TaxID=2815810 RepID=UPI002A74D408|nr:macro domain-containing protein [Floccifex sp.]MDD7280605.1 macro domain-containing protein [Erysipelotrichaceae bacterium]MDY2958869.1 macro domain-containing protein [Floccifex sp.]
MPFEIVRNDITKMEVDVIVNTASSKPIIGPGVDSHIYEEAGKELWNDRKKIGDIVCGQAKITKGYNLNAKYIIHVVSPNWNNHSQDIDLLKKSYQSALQLVLKYKCKSVAFPLLSSGNRGFPKEIAMQCAIECFSDFLLKHDCMIYLVVYDKKSYLCSEKLFHSVKSYVDDKYVDEHFYESRNIYSREMNLFPFAGSARSLDHLMEELDETFSECLIRMIDERNLKDSDVYKKANVDRRLFSKIKNNKNYQPSKVTCIAFALSLELNLDQTKELIGKAGYALTHSSKFDIVIEYFIENHNYDIYELNEVLFSFDLPLIGA